MGVLGDGYSSLQSSWSFMVVFFSLFTLQDKLEQELEAVKAERMRAAMQAAADKQLADAQQQVSRESKLVYKCRKINNCLF